MLNQIRAALARASLSLVRLEQITRALDDVEAGRDHLAVPLLINAIEGLLWTEAVGAGLIERNERGKWQAASRTGEPGRPVHELEKALALLGDRLDDGFRDFLRAVVYGGAGDPFRHGTATTGWQLRAAFLIIALMGWLELHGRIDAAATIREAFLRHRRELRDARSEAAYGAAYLPHPDDHHVDPGDVFSESPTASSTSQGDVGAHRRP